MYYVARQLAVYTDSGSTIDLHIIWNFRARPSMSDRQPKSKSKVQAGTEPQLQEIVEDAGHIVILYPKFHCELNWREHYWGCCKYFAIILYQVSNLSFPPAHGPDRPSCGNLLTAPGFRIAGSSSCS